MVASSQQAKPVRTIRLDDKHIEAIFDRLDAGVEMPNEKRAAARHRYRSKVIHIQLTQPGASEPTTFICPTRNLSQGGLACLHGGFVHVGTHCIVRLFTIHGNWQHMAGTVRRCRFVEGNVHELGIHFDEVLDPALFCSDAIQCRALLVSRDQRITRLAIHQLNQSNAIVDNADSALECRLKAAESRYDLVLVDVESEAIAHTRITSDLRSQGYLGKILAISLTPDDQKQNELENLGYSRVLSLTDVAKVLPGIALSACPEPIYSKYKADETMQPLLEEYVKELGTKILDVMAAAMANETDGLVSIIREVETSAKGHGFDEISEAAMTLQTAAGNSIQQEDLIYQARVFQEVCALARA